MEKVKRFFEFFYIFLVQMYDSFDKKRPAGGRSEYRKRFNDMPPDGILCPTADLKPLCALGSRENTQKRYSDRQFTA